MARCIWRRNVCWIIGEGSFACVAYCRHTSVSLHEDFESAQSAKRTIDRAGCGGFCTGRHEVIELVLPERHREMIAV